MLCIWFQVISLSPFVPGVDKNYALITLMLLKRPLDGFMEPFAVRLGCAVQ